MASVKRAFSGMASDTCITASVRATHLVAYGCLVSLADRLSFAS